MEIKTHSDLFGFLYMLDYRVFIKFVYNSSTRQLYIYNGNLRFLILLAFDLSENDLLDVIEDTVWEYSIF